MQLEQTETSGLPFQMVRQGNGIRFVATGSFGCVMLTAEGLASFVELKSQADAWARMWGISAGNAPSVKAAPAVNMPEVRRIARACQGTFPHGVGLLWHMIDQNVPRFVVPKGEFQGIVLNVAVLCQAMSHGMEIDSQHAAAELDIMFRDIGRIIRGR